MVLSSISPEGFSNQVVAMDQSTPNLNNQNNSGGYQVSVGGRAPAASMGSLNAQANMPGGATVMGSVPRSIYRPCSCANASKRPCRSRLGSNGRRVAPRRGRPGRVARARDKGSPSGPGFPEIPT